MISNKFIDGRHSLCYYGSKSVNKSRPSAKDGLQKRVFVIISGGWNGNLSRRRMSKLKVSMLVPTDKAAFAISSYH